MWITSELSTDGAFNCRAQVGLKISKRKGARYNRLEVLWLRNFDLAHPECTSRELTDNFNANFAGAMLPGETTPRPERSLAGLTFLRLRQPGASKKSKKKRTADDAGLGAPDESADDTGMAQDANVVQEEQDSAHDACMTQDEDVVKEEQNGAQTEGKADKW